MLKNNNQNRRLIITVGIILSVALVGLFMVNIDSASAGRSSVSGLTSTPNQTEGQPSLAGAPSGSMIGAVVKMISALVVVIVAVYVGLYFLRRLMGSKAGQNRRNDVLDIIQTTHVGQHKAIALVRVAHRAVLVGMTDSQITTLTELSEEETADILAEAPARLKPADQFAGILKTAGERLRQMSVKRRQTALES